MKKILFLAFNYPFGHFGPSDQCTTKIMQALSQTTQYEIHNVSYAGERQNYAIIDGVHIHKLGFPEKIHNRAKWLIRLLLVLKLPLYPFTKLFNCKKLYRACIPILKEDKYDIVVAQCNPEESVWAGTWLKKNGYANQLVVLFWDNIYGKLPRWMVLERFALRRQRKSENFIAKFADTLVSLYPIRDFHIKYGDVPNAIGKRVYLGIPSIAPPKPLHDSKYSYVIQNDKINILYSGTVFRSEYVAYLVELLNKTNCAEKINLIFFSRGVSVEDFSRFGNSFKGSIQTNGWIPIDELLALYSKMDYFLSFPGIPTAIRSKVFEYMSYGKPLLLLYDDDSDVNVSTFSRYPFCLSVDQRRSANDNSKIVETYLIENKGKYVNFNDVERLFPYDSISAYINLFNIFQER